MLCTPLLMLTVLIVAIRHGPCARGALADGRRAVGTLVPSLPAFLLRRSWSGGMTAGAFTPTEAARYGVYVIFISGVCTVN